MGHQGRVKSVCRLGRVRRLGDSVVQSHWTERRHSGLVAGDRERLRKQGVSLPGQMKEEGRH